MIHFAYEFENKLRAYLKKLITFDVLKYYLLNDILCVIELLKLSCDCFIVTNVDIKLLYGVILC